MAEKKVCPICDAPIKGRADKIYCSLSCKSSHQYEQRLEKDKFYLQVDKQLKKNRKILKKYNRTGMTTLRREVLHQEGFNPNFFTHYWKNQKGDVYLFCYDFGFLKLKEKNGQQTKEKYLIIEWQEYMK
jgi:predicted nucleic acid-binding Zn ribbon protein